MKLKRISNPFAQQTPFLTALKLSVGAALLVGHASAAEYYLGGADDSNTSTFTSPLTGAAVGWKLDNAGTAIAAGAGNNYTIAGPDVGEAPVGISMRGPSASGTFTFAGDALSILTGGRFLLKSPATGQNITVNNLILDGGVFDLANGVIGSNATVSGGITLESGAVFGGIGAKGSETLTFNSVIGGNGTLSIAGPTINAGADTGIVELKGLNTYLGGTNVRGGTVKLGSAAALGDSAGSLTLNGGTLDQNGNDIIQDNLTFSGGSQVATGGGVLSLGSIFTAISFVGGPATASATGAISLTGASGGDIIKYATAGTPILSGALNLGGVSRIIALADTPTDVAELTLAGVVGNGGIILDNGWNGASVQDFGTLVLSGANTYDGTTTITKGRIVISNAASLGSTVGGTTIGSRGTLALGGGGVTIAATGIIVPENLTLARNNTAGEYATAAIQNNSGNNTLTGTISLSNDATINVTGGKLEISSPIGQTAVSSLTKTGGSQLNLTGANTYSGATIITTGTLQLGNGNATGSLSINSAIVNNDALAFSRNNTITQGTDFASVISGTGRLISQGTGMVVLSGANTYTGGTTVNSGIISTRNDNAFGPSGVITSSNRNSGIQLQGGITLPATVTFVTSNDGTTGALVPYVIDNVSGNNTVNGTISLTTGGGSSIFQSDSGALTLAGNIAVAAAQSARGVILQGASTAANTVSGIISNGGNTNSLTKAGAGTWTVSGANSYTGTTNISGGTLAVTGDSSLATGTVTVAGGATLGGNGDLGGNVTIAAGGHHALSIAPTPTAHNTLGAFTRNLGPGKVLDLSAAGDILDLTATATPTPGDYILVSAPGGITGQTTGALDDTVINRIGFTGGTVKVVGTDLVLTITSGGASPYQSWISSFYPGETNPLIVGPDADPDNDGFSNSMEFALGGTPNSSGSRPKIQVMTADSDDADTAKELMMTIAVLSGTPNFTGGPSPSATSGGFTYTIEGSTTLTGFTDTVVQVATVPVGAPPAGYEFRTFSLPASNGLPSRGFLRVHVTPAP